MPHIIDVNEALHQYFTLDTAKNCFLVYFLARRALKLWRHVHARGLTRSFRDLYVHMAQVLTSLFPSFLDSDLSLSLQRAFQLLTALPSVRRKMETEMGFARVEIERSLMPKGKDVVRHLALPRNGCTLEWILDAMEQMDREAPSQTDYREGKLSGAVYRTHTFSRPSIYSRLAPRLCRWW
jgi:sphinganine-1-phosphate aldolase